MCVSHGELRRVRLVWNPQFCLLHQPRIVDDERETFGGMRIGRGNRSTWRKPVPLPFRPPHMPHDPTWARTRAAVVGSRRLTAWAMARPSIDITKLLKELQILSSMYSLFIPPLVKKKCGFTCNKRNNNKYSPNILRGPNSSAVTQINFLLYKYYISWYYPFRVLDKKYDVSPSSCFR
jgi:hypothetical protein